MRRSLTSAFTIAATLVAAAGCGGGGSSPVSPVRSSQVPAAAAPSSSTTGFGYDAAFVSRAHATGGATFSAATVDVLLKQRDLAGLKAFATTVGDPKSAAYRQFLTPDQIADRFGATKSDQAAAVAYFKKFGLNVRVWRQRLLVGVHGSRSQLEAAFHTTFAAYTSPSGEAFVGPSTPPHVDAGVPVVGSANIVARPARYARQFVPGKGGGPGLSPQQVAALFDFNGAYALGATGAGITAGVIGTGPIQLSGGGRVGDVEAYKSLYHVTGASAVAIVPTTSSDVNVVGTYGGFATPPPVTAPCTRPDGLNPSEFPTATCNPEDGEAQIDTEQTAALARDAKVEFYLAYDPDECFDPQTGSPAPMPCPSGGFQTAEQGLALADEELQTAVDHNTADTLSLSYGGPEYGFDGTSTDGEFNSDGTGLDPTIFGQLVSEGIALFVSSGDSGANQCNGAAIAMRQDSLCVSYPASDPSVVAVGGVTTPVDAAGQLVGPIAVWGEQTGASAGTGGGVSAFFAQPAYQKGLPGIIGSNRNVPDASLLGDPATGVSVLIDADKSFGGAKLGPIGGTSVAAPQLAAMWDLVLSACAKSATCATAKGAKAYRLGNPAALLYNIYKGANYATTFLPVTYGSNGTITYCGSLPPGTDPTCPSPAPSPGSLDPGYTANPAGGYNNATGLGVPFARALIRAVVGT